MRTFEHVVRLRHGSAQGATSARRNPAPVCMVGCAVSISEQRRRGCAQVRALVRDSLRHWAREYDVDGFCFVNAETMAQGEEPPPAARAVFPCAVSCMLGGCSRDMCF